MGALAGKTCLVAVPIASSSPSFAGVVTKRVVGLVLGKDTERSREVGRTSWGGMEAGPGLLPCQGVGKGREDHLCSRVLASGTSEGAWEVHLRNSDRTAG